MDDLAHEADTVSNHSTTEVETTATVNAFFTAIGSGDQPAALDLVADTVDWGGAGDPAIPWIGNRHTRAEVKAFLDLLVSNLSTEAFDVIETITEGENTAVVVRIRQTVVKTGKTFESVAVFHLRVSGRKIVRYRFYEDSLALARAYGTV